MKHGLMRTWLRTFTVQGSWNYDRMVGVGVARAMEPLLGDLPSSDGDAPSRAALRSVAGFFNAHPYLTGLAAGALARAVHDGVPAPQIDRLRNALVGPLGSIGDRLIWAGWLPISAAVGLIVVARVSPLAGVAAFLLLYNAVHLALRGWGVVVGWRSGSRVAGALAGPIFQWALHWAPAAAAFAVGVALPVAGRWLLVDLQPDQQVAAVVVGVLGFTGSRLLAPTLGGVRLGLVLTGIALIIGWVWR